MSEPSRPILNEPGFPEFNEPQLKIGVEEAKRILDDASGPPAKLQSQKAQNRDWMKTRDAADSTK